MNVLEIVENTKELYDAYLAARCEYSEPFTYLFKRTYRYSTVVRLVGLPLPDFVYLDFNLSCPPYVNGTSLVFEAEYNGTNYWTLTIPIEYVEMTDDEFNRAIEKVLSDREAALAADKAKVNSSAASKKEARDRKRYEELKAKFEYSDDSRA